MDEKPGNPPDGEEIVCRVTSWYFRRMGMMALMLAVFAALFFYDGKWGYPAKNEKASIKDRFEEEVLKGYDRAKKTDSLDQWRAEMKSKNWPVDVDGVPPTWLSYAAEHRLDEKPKKYSDREIEEQFWWGGGMMAAALVVIVLLLMNRNKVTRGLVDRFIAPNGAEVRFADVFKVDKRKWQNKGLAAIYYRASPDAPARKACLDCMKYDEKGVEQILANLLSRFSGELVEKVEEPDEDDDQQTVGEDAKT
ncbi:MAG: hypothetical protein K1X78_15195 [Verrucomicrobiaceae bacterium]|nr:hypothetical protein [Verrucomicrobiaceae bacterium]